MKRKTKRLPVQPEMCATCPFRDGSKYEFLRNDLSASALTAKSRICHSTGSNNAVYRRTGKPERICRGSRNVQLAFFAATGFINEATDVAWDQKCKEYNL